MRIRVFIAMLAMAVSSCSSAPKPHYLFYLHHTFVELHGPTGVHPEYGQVEYHQIVESFKERGLIVFSEIRPKDASVALYAERTIARIDSLLALGVDPSTITVVGTSKGGYIAQRISRELRNEEVRFVLVGSISPEDVAEGLELHGVILSICESNDSIALGWPEPVGISNGDTLEYFRQLRLNTGLKHGFLYKPLAAWIEPTVQWAYDRYGESCEEEEEEDDRIARLGHSFDSLIATGQLPFNGIFLVERNGKTVLGKISGNRDTTGEKPLVMSDQFIIGSISKQITAAMILREYDRGRLKLDVPIGNYLPSASGTEIGKVTIHQLLTHTHGIRKTKNPPGYEFAFTPGTRFEYGQIGYELLAQILEQINQKPFPELSAELFAEIGMNNTSDPVQKRYSRLTTGMMIDSSGTRTAVAAETSQENATAAGGFVSTAYDLAEWNRYLHGGRMLQPETYTLMISKYAVRDHPLFGPTDYGYGVTVTEIDSHLRIGQTGYAPGFASMSYYYPETRTSVILLQNQAAHWSDVQRGFYYTNILKLMDGVW